jgi:steroid delta-isomerase-like uncharacterized protein
MTFSSPTELLDEFAAAWNAHDVERLLACMTHDAVFYGAAGPGPGGASWQGHSQLREAFAAIWRTYPDATWSGPAHFVSADRAVTEWTFSGTPADGKRVNVRGCDVFQLREGLIAVKDTFRKQVAAS